MQILKNINFRKLAGTLHVQKYKPTLNIQTRGLYFKSYNYTTIIHVFNQHYMCLFFCLFYKSFTMYYFIPLFYSDDEQEYRNFVNRALLCLLKHSVSKNY